MKQEKGDKTTEEIWYFLSGRGKMCRKQGIWEPTMEPGLAGFVLCC